MAASDMSTKFNSTKMMAKDGFYTFSNLGSCVDIFAPGAFRIGSASVKRPADWICGCSENVKSWACQKRARGFVMQGAVCMSLLILNSGAGVDVYAACGGTFRCTQVR